MKKFLYHFLLLTLTLSAATLDTLAQSGGTAQINAKVVDASNNEAVPFATAVVLNSQTKATVRAGQTDVEGNLSIKNLPAGSYTFKISYVGFQTMVREGIQLANSQVYSLGTIRMKAAKGTELNEVVIQGEKAAMQLGIDKKVFSVDKSLVSEGGTATDLLANVPSVQTDMDGNVSLRGSSGVRVLIDGKPSLIGGGDVSVILQSIPASSIESVEVITNPSSKYDAEGQSGIINIVLKKNTKLGLNGNVALSAGNRENYNANTSLSFQNNKVNLFGNYSYRSGNRLGGGFNNIQYLNTTPEGTAFADQNTDSRSHDQGHNVKAGIDYTLAPKSVLSFSGGFNMRDNDRRETLLINQFNTANSPVRLSNRRNENEGKGNSFDLNLDFVQKFKKPKEELTFNLNYSEGNNDNFQFYNTDIYFQTNQSLSNLVLERNLRDGWNRNYNIQADYVRPIGTAGRIEAGYRSQFRDSKSMTDASTFLDSLDAYQQNFLVSNAFESGEQIHALYLNYQNQIGNFGYQLGLRGEDAELNTTSGRFQETGSTIYTPGKIAYTRLYPSVFVSQKLKNEQQVQLSYTRRVNRPRGWDTNPFLDVSDPLMWNQGNPNLKPEDVHAFEFGYSKYFKKVSFISSLYFRQTNDLIQRVRSEPNAQGVTISTPQNLTRNIATGLELISRVDVAKPWNFTANVNLYQSKIDGAPEYGIIERSGFTWNANLTNNFNLPYNITLQLRADYRAPEVMAQGKRNAMYGVDAGAKYDFKDKKSSLSLNVRDVFSTRRWSMTTEANNSIVDFERYMQGTMANLTYSYRFGKTTFTAKKPKRDQEQRGGDDEQQF
ncbi:TonB-dependent receptor domain-containing protein [Pedobacter sp. SAFR-022]|uniref:TonB-dependent receptor domain-containing protein n=1 Tax=Pedobacter sp. SAFR-022 TaxID=3436861 RepID=UPI003F7D6CB0